MEKIDYVIKKEYANITIKELLERFFVGKSNAYKLFFEKRIYVNGIESKQENILRENDVLSIQIDEKVDFKTWDETLNILYEDEYILIVDKPSGIIIHPDGDNDSKTLVNLVASYYQKNNINRQVRYIHRIDTQTSGIVVFAKDFLTFSLLNHQIETHEIKREYLALVQGIMKSKKGTINQPIGRDRHVQNKYRVGESKNSKNAITNYFLEKTFINYSLVRLLLETGRTHQIRVHMSHLGYPLLGDTLYGGSNKLINRVALHSYRVSLIHPVFCTKLIVEAPLHKDMKGLLGDKND